MTGVQTCALPIFLVGLSAAIHAIGVLGAHGDWNRRNGTDRTGERLFSLRDTQIEAHARHFAGLVGRAFQGASRGGGRGNRTPAAPHPGP